MGKTKDFHLIQLRNKNIIFEKPTKYEVDSAYMNFCRMFVAGDKRVSYNLNKMEENNLEKIEKESIDSFLKVKDKLLTAFGVFLALTLFTKDLDTNSLYGNYLSFIFMSLTILVWLELWSSFPAKNRSWTLVIFENLINIGTMLLILYWFVEYYEKGKLFVFIWIAAGISSILSKIQEKLGWTNPLKEKKIWKYMFVRYILGFLFMGFYLILTLVIAALIMGGLNPLVEAFKK